MKRIIYHLLCSIAVVAVATSCNDVDSPNIPDMDAPVLISSTPADGTTGLSDEDLTIELIYDQNVYCPSAGHELITLSGGATIAGVSADFAKITIDGQEVSRKVVSITATGLQKGVTYTLHIPEGVILGPTYVGALAHSISFTTKAAPVLATALVNPNATTQARKVFAYLLENYGEKTLSATMANVNWNTENAGAVYTLTGKYPAMNCFDYVHIYASGQNWIDYSDISPVLDWWNAGGLVTAMWHWNVPVSDGSGTLSFYSENNNFDAANATAEGTWENEVFTTDLAKVAASLKQLQNAGIAVIWRPFHEASGGWFWWGKDAGSYKKLWVAMFDYFQAEGINNLIWVWTSETGDDEWYPGSDYVDIVGIDIYEKDAASTAASFNTLYGDYGHIVALSECGTVDTISEQWAAGAKWSWFMPWYDGEGATSSHATDEWWQDAMNQDFVVTRDQLPSFQ